MVGWRHRLKGYEFEQAPGVGDGQGGLACCIPWGHKELDMTELNWAEPNEHPSSLHACLICWALSKSQGLYFVFKFISISFSLINNRHLFLAILEDRKSRITSRFGVFWGPNSRFINGHPVHVSSRGRGALSP